MNTTIKQIESGIVRYSFTLVDIQGEVLSGSRAIPIPFPEIIAQAALDGLIQPGLIRLTVLVDFQHVN